jgi:hypothetical protein
MRKQRLSRNPKHNNNFSKTGGQKGHKGHTLKMSAQPDHIIVHTVKTCSDCGHSLEGVLPANVEKRQVFDLPPLQVELPSIWLRAKSVPVVSLRG